MNSHASDTILEPRWKTYLRGAAFSIPALFTLAFSSVYLLPKLETLWRDAAFGDIYSMAPWAIRAVHVAYFVTHHLGVFAVAVILAFALLEWRSDRWPRYRRASVGVAAFVANTSILIFITAMFMTALMAAPALLRMR